MAKTLDELEEEVLGRSEDDRLHILQRLIDSVGIDDEVQSAWIEECRHRYEEIRAGKRELIDHDEVMAELRANERVRGTLESRVGG